ncbi:AMP-binding protein [Accumulibacter sp.]|uniref:AMP-binding protein n=1 Tax=Candidatus Accumulibacter proximus TaxID=2954385 RepID=A0A935Q1D9_9PROT|nr:AMP-binding protein [Accumulibacter sp.]MBK7676294.1 AMP-binding protein [Candidatus Accumulibacter proximus]MBL8375220.1 AMP-binding protein [Accumulibacter sp.]
MSGGSSPAHAGSEYLFAALAKRSPDAIVLQGTRQTWRASELLSAVDDLAARIAGTRVLAVLAGNGPAWVIADLAALRAGTVHLPLPDFFSQAQLAHVFEQSGADSVLTDQPERIAGLNRGFAVVGKWNGLLLLQRLATPIDLPPGTAKVSFTSGSTGAPKGACLSAVGLMDTASAVARRLADLPIDRHLAVLPLSLLLENTAGVYAPLLRGAEILVPDLPALGWQGMSGFDPAALQRAVATAAPGSLILVPELLKLWALFLAASGQEGPASLCYVAVGGARVSPALLDQARTQGLPAYQGYGLTECGSVVSLNRPGDDGDDAGRPLDHVSVRIAEGEIVVGTQAFLGYVGDDAVVRPAIPASGREFATGDLGRFDTNGHLHLSGRRKNLLITSYGRNIAPEWVESVLLAEPAIAQALVFGDGRPWLSALLVAAPGIDRGALDAAVQRSNHALPDYARIARWHAAAPFTAQNGLATGNGRPIRTAICRHHAAELAALYSEEEASDVVL